MAGRSIAVVGGGLAGLAAAVELTERGCDVELFERSRLLGGRATSFFIGNREVDNGQHAFLGCCTELIAFAERLKMGGALRLQERFDVLVLRRGGEPSRLRAATLPAPWHLIVSFARYGYLSWSAKIQVARALAAAREPWGDTQMFAQWLDRHGQNDETRRAFWEPFFVPALNAPLAEMETRDALFVLTTAFLGDPGAARFGFATVPLAHLAAAAAERLAGVHLSTQVLALDLSSDGHEVRGVLTPDGSRPFDSVVLALPPPQLARLLGEPGQLGVAPLDGYRARPIIDVHVWHDRGRLGFDFAALIDSPVQWIFEKDAGYLCCSISAAEDYVRRGTQELVRLCWDELIGTVPGLAGAQLEQSAVTRNVEATFSAPPGTQPPGPATACVNLAIAGSWTDTGWPDTMESAVRSGLRAARHLLDERNVTACVATPR